MPFVGAANVDTILSAIREGEDWLEDDGSDANLTEYNKRYRDLNRKYESFKSRKEEHFKRDDSVAKFQTTLQQLKSKAETLTVKKPWITDDQVKDVLEQIERQITLIEDQIDQQKKIPID